jgi:Zn-dependent metalloprotease
MYSYYIYKKMPKKPKKPEKLKDMRSQLLKQSQQGLRPISVLTKTREEREAEIAAREAAEEERKAEARRAKAEAQQAKAEAQQAKAEAPQAAVVDLQRQEVIEESLEKDPLVNSFKDSFYFEKNDPLKGFPLEDSPVELHTGRKQTVIPYQGKRHKMIDQSNILENLEKRIKETSGGATHRRRQNNNKTAKQRKLFKKRSTRRRQIHKRNRSH